MPLFWKPYKSEVTNFIEELKARKPTLEAEQRAGRALLWDRTLDRSQQSEWREAAVPQQPYVYQTKT
ncbi:acetyl-CoA carboxyl transferase [beta proteobacterium AAP51]|nr:acetyl-CoA carboxyl transferase [beta proteobacterium AAP51]